MCNHDFFLLLLVKWESFFTPTMSLKRAPAQWCGHRSPCFLLQFESNLQGRTSVSPCQGVFEATSADIQYLQLAVATVFEKNKTKKQKHTKPCLCTIRAWSNGCSRNETSATLQVKVSGAHLPAHAVKHMSHLSNSNFLFHPSTTDDCSPSSEKKATAGK